MRLQSFGATPQQENYVWSHGYVGSGIDDVVLELVAQRQHLALEKVAVELFNLRHLVTMEMLTKDQIADVLLEIRNLVTRAGG